LLYQGQNWTKDRSHSTVRVNCIRPERVSPSLIAHCMSAMLRALQCASKDITHGLVTWRGWQWAESCDGCVGTDCHPSYVRRAKPSDKPHSSLSFRLTSKTILYII